MNSALQIFLNAHDTIIRVELVDQKGSSPRDVGAAIFVTAEATFGTIGGGQLEYIAIDEARRMLRRRQGEQTLTIPLGPEIGQCCGGMVALYFLLMDHRARLAAVRLESEEMAARPDVYIFGAGHVGRALADCLRLLPVRTVVVDSRAEEMALVPSDVEQRLVPLPEAEMRKVRAGAAFVILTHDHALDFLLTQEALQRGDAAYVGMIGSKSKRATFRHWLQDEQGEDAEGLFEDLTCPIGGNGSRDKRPAVIASLVAAEVMIAFDTYSRAYRSVCAR